MTRSIVTETVSHGHTHHVVGVLAESPCRRGLDLVVREGVSVSVRRRPAQDDSRGCVFFSWFSSVFVGGNCEGQGDELFASRGSGGRIVSSGAVAGCGQDDCETEMVLDDCEMILDDCEMILDENCAEDDKILAPVFSATRTTLPVRAEEPNVHQNFPEPSTSNSCNSTRFTARHYHHPTSCSVSCS